MKEVVILGATGGIGSAIVRAMASKEVRLWLHYNQGQQMKEALSAWLDEQGVHYRWLQGDFLNKDAARLFFNALDKETEGIDCFINAMGSSKHELFQWVSQDDWEQLRMINLDAFVYSAQEAVSRMFNRPGANLILVSSVWGQVGSAMEVHYSVTKAGVIGLVRALAKELGPSGIRVNGVAPGWIDTAMNDQFDDESKAAFESELPLGRIGSPAEVAACVAFLSSPASAYLTGQVLNPNGGLHM